ncbi:hypothetical protein SAMN04515673_101524 [Poseidonocella sedimentorum]|uniref:Uncharacterized protein n=1 Tax=Poseidonocella sedimentorum TaxID=871652 RepID=A0A1I6CX40_9RHOB|nr:hypothetical protein SAMN04515673_101524 [Poseidonocella sedimentorum]
MMVLAHGFIDWRGATSPVPRPTCAHTVERSARRHAGQPPTAPMGGGFSPARGRALPSLPRTTPEPPA